VHLDFGETQRGKTFLIAADASTGWLEAEATKGMGSAETIKICRTLCRRLGLCDAFVCDNGPAFRSAEFQDFCARNQIKLIFAPPYSPATNGLAERSVQTVKKFLKKTAAQDWDSQLDSFLLGHNTTPSPDTQVSPAEKMMGRRLKTLLSKMHPAELQLTKRLERDADVVAALPTETPKNLQQGSPVLYRLYVNNRVTWQPGTVTSLLGPRRVEIESADLIKITRHVDQVKPVLQPDDSGDSFPRNTNAESVVEKPDETPMPPDRPKRQVKRPARYQC
jgi:Integrase core domain